MYVLMPVQAVGGSLGLYLCSCAAETGLSLVLTDRGLIHWNVSCPDTNMT